MSRFITNIKMCYKWNRLNSWLLGWFLSPPCDEHECAYTCVSLSFVWKWNKNRFVNMFKIAYLLIIHPFFQIYENYYKPLHVSLSTVVLNSRDWPRKNGIQNFGLSKIHLRVRLYAKNKLKCIGTSTITLYLC